MEALEGRLSGLPAGVVVERDRIEVRYAGATEAVAKLMALAQGAEQRLRALRSARGGGGKFGMSEGLVPAVTRPPVARTTRRRGPAWGYGGSGLAQLALVILLT